MKPLRTFVAAALIANSFSSQVFAQSNDDKALALGLFEQGRALLKQGDYRTAAVKFEGAANLLHTYGVLYNLADCYEKLGRTASAWSTWREARSVAHASQKTDDESFAAARQQALEPKLSRLTVIVPAAADRPDLAILRNGAALPRAAWGSAMPVDPGLQKIEALAQGFRPRSIEIDVGAEGDKRTVTIAPLDPAPASAVPLAADAAGGALQPPAEKTSATPAHPAGAEYTTGAPSRPLPLPWIGWIAAGAGVATATVGIVELAAGQSKMNDAVDRANQANAGHDATAYGEAADELSSGHSRRTAGEILLGIGGAIAIGGALLAIAAPRTAAQEAPAASSFSPWFAAGSGGLAWSGRW